MENIDTNDLQLPTDFSICNNCSRLMVRTVLPMDMESFGIDEEVLKELEIGEDEDIEILYYTCLETMQDMDYIVLNCNKFKDKRKKGLLVGEHPF